MNTYGLEYRTSPGLRPKLNVDDVEWPLCDDLFRVRKASHREAVCGHVLISEE